VTSSPVTNVSFAGQNIHYTYCRGWARRYSTGPRGSSAGRPRRIGPGIRVINSDYSTEWRAVGASKISSLRAKQRLARELYKYFRNEHSTLHTAAGKRAHVLRTKPIRRGDGRPIRRIRPSCTRTTRRSARRIAFLQFAVLTKLVHQQFQDSFNLPVEPNLGSVLRTNDTTTVLSALIVVSDKPESFCTLFSYDGRLLNQSPLNDGSTCRPRSEQFLS